MQRYNFSIIPPKKCGRKKMRKKDAEERCGRKMRKKTMCLIGLLSESAETPVFIGISAFRNKSHNGVTTEAERRQNGGRTYEGRSLDSDRIS